MSNKKKHLIVGISLGVVGFLLVVFVAVGLTSGGSGEREVGSQGVAVDTRDTAKLGEMIQKSGVAYGTLPLKLTKDFGSLRYLCVQVTIQNYSQSPVSFNGGFDWQFESPSGVRTYPTITGLKNQLGAGEIRPGGMVVGNLCTDDTDKGDYKLIQTEEDLTWTGTYA